MRREKAKHNISVLLFLLGLFVFFISVNELKVNATPAVTQVTITAQAHVQNIGWQDAIMVPIAPEALIAGKTDVSYIGTIGKSLRMEAIRFSLNGFSDGSGITYKTHVQNIGWQSYVSDGADGGTTGRSLRVEAIMISLTGPIASDYDVYYRTHIQNYGWLGWAKNGSPSGSAGKSLRMEALQICLVRKGDKAPTGSGDAYVAPLIQYSAHVQNVGWQSYVTDDAVAGTTGKSLRMEALKVGLYESNLSGNVVYQAYVTGVGWQNYTSNTGIAGTVGQSKPIEAVRLKLEGDVANQYDIWYSVHTSNIGWQQYASNDNPAGTIGLSQRIEAIKIRLIKKGGKPSIGGAPAFIQGIADSEFSYTVKTTDNQTKLGSKNGAEILFSNASTAISTIALQYTPQNAATAKGNISYSVHVSNKGWLSSVTAPSVTGDTSAKESIQAVKFSLQGDIANYYDIWYRTYVKGMGWMGWALNGQNAGTTKLSLPIQGIQIKLVPKGAAAPGANSNYYRDSYKVIVIDPGHTGAGQDAGLEPIGPGSKTMKKKDSSGTSGRYSGIPEYQLNMTISKKLKTELEKRGYTVYLTHETNIAISNIERANVARAKKADIYVRIHANGSENSSVHGALTIAPTSSNPYLGSLISPSQRLAQIVLNEYCKATGMTNRGVWYTDTMTGNNWSPCPVTLVEMGYMTNRTDDLNMANAAYQTKMVNGIANGIDAYFK
ncbi:MAG: N-acetylmuramoyl-L-alanine amidase [Lachnospiraceae bacterium]|jgi:uncharacterized protein YjdB|nr:N-acetylmuramoyl-L-alanine amidase [Lachnospiraceae bacterium]